jgi:hypothetical protein
MESKLQPIISNIIARSMTAVRCLCYRPTVLHRHLRLTALLFPQGKILVAFKKSYCFNFY